MKPPSFESPSDNPYIRKPDSEGEPLDTPKKKDNKKEKDRKNKGDKKYEGEKEQKRGRKPVVEEEEETKKKPPKKSEKEKKEDDEEEALEEKKQKRQSLVERSLNYKKLYEEMPIPHDPWVVARLMVAEHILAIQSQIEQPAPDATPLDELRLLASLDYMGTIADTLENPNIEATPEVKETCDTIVQLAQDTLDEGDENIIETLVTANTDSAQILEQDTQKGVEHSDPLDVVPESLPISGAALLAVLAHIRQRSHQHTPSASPVVPTIPPIAQGVSGATRPAATTSPTSPTQPAAASPTSPPVQGDGHAAPPSLHIPRRDTPLINPERHVTPQGALSNYLERPIRAEAHPASSLHASAPLASFVIAAALGGPHASRSSAHTGETSASLPSRSSYVSGTHSPIGAAPAQQRYAHETSYAPSGAKAGHAPEHISSPAYSQPVSSSENHSTAHPTSIESPGEAISHPSHKIEHLPLVSLLAMAETVSIGHGQRLRSAYEKGTIDKEGLVKILKSHSKHHDFLQEYRQQVVKRRNLVQSSPEFLSSSQPKDDTSAGAASPETTVHEPTALPMNFQPDINITDFTPTTDLPKPEKQTAPADIFATPDEKIFHPTWLVPILIGVLILAVGILFAFLILR